VLVKDAMYNRDRAALRTPARILDVIVRVSNLGIGLWGILLTAIAVLEFFPQSVRDAAAPALIGMSRAEGVLAIVAIPAWHLFRFGVVKCPCCREGFARHGFWILLPRRCTSCGFDVRTVSRPGDF
jgi:hypothetical protein